ncbi:hypothetical protein [Litoribacterium kuwaitense]|nr:hypothetical protein [Litoribacterium kuwaitense]
MRTEISIVLGLAVLLSVWLGRNNIQKYLVIFIINIMLTHIC